MNLDHARRYARFAVVQRDCALWFEQRARSSPSPAAGARFLRSAQNCRDQMRIAAKRMADHLLDARGTLAVYHDLCRLGHRILCSGAATREQAEPSLAAEPFLSSVLCPPSSAFSVRSAVAGAPAR